MQNIFALKTLTIITAWKHIEYKLFRNHLKHTVHKKIDTVRKSILIKNTSNCKYIQKENIANNILFIVY